MGSPDDANPLFQRLADFLFSDRFEEFRRSASRRCESASELLFAGGRRGEEDPRFFDYLVFSHRNADGLTGLDLFLNQEGPSLPPEEREAIARFRDSVYGLFEVEEF